MIDVRVLGAHEACVLDNCAPGVFDNVLDTRSCAEFFACPRHHLAVALDGKLVVGMASGVHYIHPDKPPELWVNEIGVAESYRHQGLGRRMLDVLFAHAATLGCRDAWVLTEESNTIARRMYDRAGGEDIGVVMYSFRLGPEAAIPVV